MSEKKKGTKRSPRGSIRAERAQSAMSGPLLEKIKDRASSYNPTSRVIYKRAMTGRSRKDAMTAFCVMCMGYSSSEVKNCTDLACPLFPYRR